MSHSDTNKRDKHANVAASHCNALLVVMDMEDKSQNRERQNRVERLLRFVQRWRTRLLQQSGECYTLTWNSVTQQGVTAKCYSKVLQQSVTTKCRNKVLQQSFTTKCYNKVLQQGCSNKVGSVTL